MKDTYTLCVFLSLFDRVDGECGIMTAVIDNRDDDESKIYKLSVMAKQDQTMYILYQHHEFMHFKDSLVRHSMENILDGEQTLNSESITSPLDEAFIWL